MLINYKNGKCLWTKWHCGQTVINAWLLDYLCNILVHAVTCVLSVSSRHLIYRSQSWSVWVTFSASLLYKATETWSTRLAGLMGREGMWLIGQLPQRDGWVLLVECRVSISAARWSLKSRGQAMAELQLSSAFTPVVSGDCCSSVTHGVLVKAVLKLHG